MSHKHSGRPDPLAASVAQLYQLLLKLTSDIGYRIVYDILPGTSVSDSGSGSLGGNKERASVFKAKSAVQVTSA